MSLRNVSLRLSILMAALVLLACQGKTDSEPATVAQDAPQSAMGTLVTTEWLSQHLNDSDLVVLDCNVIMQPKEGGGMRSLSGRAAYENGHIPSAGFADLTSDLCDTSSAMGFALPTPEEFCAAMGALGVGDNSRVVLYDSFRSVWAARVWWMLRWVGFDRAALLDGGLKAWSAEGRPLSTEPAGHRTRTLTPKPRPELIAYYDEVSAAISADSISLIDAMHEPHFQGSMALYGRPGHIPGAINVPATSLVDTLGHYRSQEELAALFDGDPQARAITYCGAGVAASSNAYVMHRLGFTNVAVYMASLQEWAADSANPMVVGTP
jgi:thiosulfate/3-mercaptopyruvate sulfurtransferase